MTNRFGWQVLLLVPLIVAIYGLSRVLRSRSLRDVFSARTRFLIVSVLVHVGLLFVFDLILITIPVVEANKEFIEAAILKTFSIFPSGRGGSGPSWEKLPEGPPPADPVIELAEARVTAGQQRLFDPALNGIATTIPDSMARTLPSNRVLFVPPPSQETAVEPSARLPRAAIVEPELPRPEPSRLNRHDPTPEVIPEAPAISIGRHDSRFRPASPGPVTPPTIEPRFPAPAPAAMESTPPGELTPPTPLVKRVPRNPSEVDPATLDSPDARRLTASAASDPMTPSVDSALTSLPKMPAKEAEPMRMSARLDPPLVAPVLPRRELLTKLERTPPPLPAMRLPASSLTPARASEPPDLMASFSLRSPEVRKDLVEAMGGTKASEMGVERGLAWLAAHQGPAGNWSLEDLHCQGHKCDSPGSARSDAAATGLALMAFLGAGHSPTGGSHSAVARRGVEWLVARQRPDGSLAEPGGSQMYGHALASIALCEAFGLGGDPTLREPATRAVRFIIQAQDPNTGGWRYQPRSGGDTSVFGWQVMALKSAEMAGLAVPAESYRLANRWLDSVASGPQRHLYAYQPGREVRSSMTAEALLCRQYLGAARSTESMSAGGRYLRTNLPQWEARHSYYWYYATQVMFHLQGEDWAAWNGRLREMLVESQVKDGPAAGSWHPLQPTQDMWGEQGGRIYETTLSLLILEVYYRHLPLYQQLSDDGKLERR
ncbi:MAG: squalene/oxidosqualene cyclase [Planctomycetota bacterium]|nr:squalene/oxidosqualene cyclase [Planctomycetota bacterium]